METIGGGSLSRIRTGGLGRIKQSRLRAGEIQRKRFIKLVG